MYSGEPTPILVPSLHCSDQPEAVSLIVFAHHVSNHGDHAEVDKAVFAVMRDAIRMERVDAGHAVAGHITEPDPVFDVNRSYAAGLENLQELRRQEIHLRKEALVVIVMAESRYSSRYIRNGYRTG
jgi:hypothetical protein